MDTIVVAEDQPIYREMLVEICGKLVGCRVVGSSGIGVEVVRLCAEHCPKILILDWELEDMDGFQLLDELHRHSVSPRVLVISAFLDEYTLVRIQRIGVEAVLDKVEAGSAQLVQAIGALRLAVRFRSPAMDRLRQRNASDPFSWTKLLSRREEHVLRMIGLGFSDEEISSALGITCHAAHHHRRQIMRKLDLHETPKVVLFAIQHGFARVAGRLVGRRRSGKDVKT